MDIEKLKELTEELEKLEELSSNYLNELELIYEFSASIISEIYFEIKNLKTEVGNKFSFDMLLAYLETALFNNRIDLEYYAGLSATLDLDDEMLGEVGKAQELIKKRIKRYEKILGVSERKPNLKQL